MGTFWGPKIWKKVPMGTQVPKWGLIWEQWKRWYLESKMKVIKKRLFLNILNLEDRRPGFGFNCQLNRVWQESQVRSAPTLFLRWSDWMFFSSGQTEQQWLSSWPAAQAWCKKQRQRKADAEHHWDSSDCLFRQTYQRNSESTWSGCTATHLGKGSWPLPFLATTILGGQHLEASQPCKRQ